LNASLNLTTIDFKLDIAASGDRIGTEEDDSFVRGIPSWQSEFISDYPLGRKPTPDSDPDPDGDPDSDNDDQDLFKAEICASRIV
jgi:hypothetical protein